MNKQDVNLAVGFEYIAKISDYRITRIWKTFTDRPLPEGIVAFILSDSEFDRRKRLSSWYCKLLFNTASLNKLEYTKEEIWERMVSEVNK